MSTPFLGPSKEGPFFMPDFDLPLIHELRPATSNHL